MRHRLNGWLQQLSGRIDASLAGLPDSLRSQSEAFKELLPRTALFRSQALDLAANIRAVRGDLNGPWTVD